MSDSKQKLPEIHIVAGFLGAGKTTFLNRYLPLLTGITVVIENEAGTVGVDGALLPEGYPVRELSAGCICCTLAPQLEAQLREIDEQFAPDQVVIEPSGVGNMSDIVLHCINFGFAPSVKIAMVDACEFEDYASGFGTFYMDQIDNANVVLLTHQAEMQDEQIEGVAREIRQSNPQAHVLSSDWRELGDNELRALVDGAKDDLTIFEHVQKNKEDKHHHHHNHNFKNNGFEQLCFTDLKKWDERTSSETKDRLLSGDFGEIYRAKGFVEMASGEVSYFDFTPSFCELTSMQNRIGSQDLRFVVIGKNLDKERLDGLLK